VAGRVTGLRLQGRSQSRVNVFVDGEFSFALARILAAELAIGQTLSDDEIARLRSRDAEESAYRKALGLIQRRPRSEWELRQAFRRQGIDEQIQESALRRLRETGVLDDLAFAKYWVDNRQAFRPRGRRALRAELRLRGVDRDAAEQAVSAVEEDEAAYQAAHNAALRLAGAPKDEFRRRLGAYLARRGFDHEVIRPAVERLWVEQETAGG
jgi:regulatory protein